MIYADRNKYKPGTVIIRLFFIIIICVVNLPFFAQQNEKIDSLLNLLKNGREDTNKVNHLCKLTRECEFTGNFEIGLSYGKAALELAQKLNFKKGIANAGSNLGNIYLGQADYAKALDHYVNALKIDEELNDLSGKAKRLGNIGIVYKEQSNYSKALDYYFKTLKICEETKNKNGIAICLGNIGIIYSAQDDKAKALVYYFKALKITEDLGDKNGIARHLSNIGIIYDDLGKTQSNPAQKADLLNKALDYYYKALKIIEEIGDKNGNATQLSNIGMVYSEQKEYSRALDNYFRALKINEEIGDKNGIAVQLGNIGSVYTSTKKYKEAYNYLYRALVISDSIAAIDDVNNWYLYLSILYEKSTVSLPDTIGGKILNMEQMSLRSLYYFKMYKTLRDTIFSEENKKELVRKEMNFDFEKKQAATKAEQEKKDIIAGEELKLKENQRNYFIAGFAFVAILALFILRSYRQKQKDNFIITEQKKMVEKKQEEILDSIYYAKKIQSALLPNEKHITKNLIRLTKNLK